MYDGSVENGNEKEREKNLMWNFVDKVTMKLGEFYKEQYNIFLSKGCLWERLENFFGKKRVKIHINDSHIFLIRDRYKKESDFWNSSCPKKEAIFRNFHVKKRTWFSEILQVKLKRK